MSNEVSEVRSIRADAEALDTEADIIELYEAELKKVRTKINDRNRVKRQSLQRRIEDLQSGAEYKSLEKKLNSALKKNEELVSLCYELRAECVRLRRLAEAEKDKQDELTIKVSLAEARADKAERAARNLQLYMEMAGGKKRCRK